MSLDPAASAEVTAYRWVPPMARGLAVLALEELCGDKLPFAPDRIVPPGLIAHGLSAGSAGAALAPRKQARLGALLGASTAIASAYLTFARRKRTRRFGQVRSGLVEDAATLVLSQLALRTAGS